MTLVSNPTIKLDPSWYPKELPSPLPKEGYSETEYRPSEASIEAVETWALQSEEDGLNDDPLTPHLKQHYIDEYEKWEQSALVTEEMRQTKFLLLWEVNKRDLLFTNQVSVLLSEGHEEIIRLAVVAMRAPYISKTPPSKPSLKPTAHYNPKTQVFKLSSEEQRYYLREYAPEEFSKLASCSLNEEWSFMYSDWENYFEIETTGAFEPPSDVKNVLNCLQEGMSIKKSHWLIQIPKDFYHIIDKNTTELHKYSFNLENLLEKIAKRATRFPINPTQPPEAKEIQRKYPEEYWALFPKTFDIKSKTYQEHLTDLSRLPTIDDYQYRLPSSLEISALFLANFISTSTVLWPDDESCTCSYPILCSDPYDDISHFGGGPVDEISTKNKLQCTTVQFDSVNGISVKVNPVDKSGVYYTVPTLIVDD